MSVSWNASFTKQEAPLMGAVGSDSEERIRRVPNAISGISDRRRRPQMVPFDSPNAISY